MGLNVPPPRNWPRSVEQPDPESPIYYEPEVGAWVLCQYCNVWGNVPSCKHCGAALSPPPPPSIPLVPRPYEKPAPPHVDVGVPDRPKPKVQPPITSKPQNARDGGGWREWLGLPPADNTRESK